ncbi:MAG: ribonuclease P protein component [Candidatus Kerfeldbacteria bacterium CG08_land_8_20_14_0_20_43_14]|uniref:Ribonuclease P protein component n=1 Tax=Candidatus Kerfeldbacteria bacterium CG08_land_8_20_14_0_20_43_14 TaxID=2014246 RepID=A0A2H0YQ40_9BACT|nr:MAG: ribonuclease P protein component [Candidatus Kerfeldbacteria bacterium CG08_land_8_20_14_0_20_43_14]
MKVLPRFQRLHQEKDIRKVLRFGQKRRDENLQLIFSPNPKPNSRACVIISKKIAKKAHERNKIRRQIQALLPKYLKSQPRPLDIIIRVNSQAEFKQKNFDNSLNRLWLNYGNFRSTRRH